MSQKLIVQLIRNVIVVVISAYCELKIDAITSSQTSMRNTTFSPSPDTSENPAERPQGGRGVAADSGRG